MGRYSAGFLPSARGRVPQACLKGDDMRTFDYRNLPKDLFHRAAGDLNVRVYEDRGKLAQLESFHPEVLEKLREKALLDGVVASARIEGLAPDVQAVRAAVRDNAYGDDEMAQHVGYARALKVIDEHAAELELSSGTVIDLYEQLYCNRVFGARSRYRTSDYAQVMVDGHRERVLVSPVHAFESPLVLGAACDSLAAAFNANTCSPVILTAVFAVDMLCIRPFDTGNGRVSRLFSNLLLRKAGFGIARYSSVDAVIERHSDEYYRALNSCAEGWDRGRNDYTPYVLFFLEAVHEAHQRLFDEVELLCGAGASKTDRVRLFVARSGAPVTKRQILEAHPDISVSAVENALGALVKEHAVEKRGAGRSTAYVWVGAKL